MSYRPMSYGHDLFCTLELYQYVDSKIYKYRSKTDFDLYSVDQECRCSNLDGLERDARDNALKYNFVPLNTYDMDSSVKQKMILRNGLLSLRDCPLSA